MSTKPVPDEWARRMTKLGFVHRGQPSISALARKANVSVETARRFINRAGTSTGEVVEAISEAMREDMSWWIGSRPAGEVYVGPDASRFLDDRQKQALTDLIHAFVKGAAWELGIDRSEDEVPGVAGVVRDAPPATRVGSVDLQPGSASHLRSVPTDPG